MEDLIVAVMEDSIVSGGFLFLLYYVTQQNQKNIEKLLTQSEAGFKQLSDALTALNERIRNLEDKN